MALLAAIRSRTAGAVSTHPTSLTLELKIQVKSWLEMAANNSACSLQITSVRQIERGGIGGGDFTRRYLRLQAGDSEWKEEIQPLGEIQTYVESEGFFSTLHHEKDGNKILYIHWGVDPI